MPRLRPRGLLNPRLLDRHCRLSRATRCRQLRNLAATIGRHLLLRFWRAERRGSHLFPAAAACRTGHGGDPRRNPGASGDPAAQLNAARTPPETAASCHAARCSGRQWAGRLALCISNSRSAYLCARSVRLVECAVVSCSLCASKLLALRAASLSGHENTDCRQPHWGGGLSDENRHDCDITVPQHPVCDETVILSHDK